MTINIDVSRYLFVAIFVGPMILCGILWPFRPFFDKDSWFHLSLDILWIAAVIMLVIGLASLSNPSWLLQ